MVKIGVSGDYAHLCIARMYQFEYLAPCLTCRIWIKWLGYICFRFDKDNRLPYWPLYVFVGGLSLDMANEAGL